MQHRQTSEAPSSHTKQHLGALVFLLKVQQTWDPQAATPVRSCKQIFCFDKSGLWSRQASNKAAGPMVV